MVRIFLPRLTAGLPNCSVGGSTELIHIHRLRYEAPPEFEETELMAKNSLDGLVYQLRIQKGNGELSKKGDFFLNFPIPSHFIILARDYENYAAVINIGWRGMYDMKPEERAKYLAFLQKYFRI